MDNSPQQGVLYLPNSYVVPGGFLNEMYGWDSYFIMVGLLRAGRLELARGMVENFFFEIEHYGGILNANRTYFLTRSQPPFLSSMVMALYDALPDPATKRLWLEKSYPFIQRDYDMWTSGEKLAGNTGLSRYLRLWRGAGPRDRHHARPVLPRCVSLSAGFAAGQGISRRAGQIFRQADWTDVHLRSLPAGCRRERLLREVAGLPVHRRLLQGRPRHARVRLRHFLPLRRFQRQHPSLCAGMPEQPFVQGRNGHGVDQQAAGQDRRGRAVDPARATSQGAHRPLSVERAGGNVFRLRFHQGRAVEVSVRHHVLSAVGGRSVAASRPRRSWQTSRTSSTKAESP